MTANKLRDLEKRLREEPDNVGLRVMFAGALREAGRDIEAIELYRSVAIAYRDQGRTQQALAVCRSILELSPHDEITNTMLVQLGGKPSSANLVIEPSRRSSKIDQTPLPRPVPYHVADPTTASLAKLSARDILDIPTLAEGSDEKPLPPPPRPGSDSGLAAAARRISRQMSQNDSYDSIDMGDGIDVAQELSTRRIPKLSEAEIPTEDEDAITVPPRDPSDTLRDMDDEFTEPFDLLGARAKVGAKAKPASPFFAPLPDEERQAVLGRFIARTVSAGTVVIRQGEQHHPLVLVARGRLDVRTDRGAQIGTIAAGEFVGEIALLARAAAHANVVAATEAELLLLAPKAFYEVIAAYPALLAELKDTADRRRREYASKR